MKHLLLGLALCSILPLMAAEEGSSTQKKINPAELSAQQKEELIARLVNCDAMDSESQQAILQKLLENQELNSQDMALLEAYGLDKVPAAATISFGNLFSRFINIRQFAIGVASNMLNDSGVNEEVDKLQVALAVIQSLQMKDLKITIKGHTATLGDYIDQKEFNEAIAKIIEERTKGKVRPSSLALYHLLLVRSLKRDAFERILTPTEVQRLIIDDRQLNIGYLLLLFGFLEDGFQETDRLNDLFDRVLMNDDIEHHTLLNCINFREILLGLGYKERELPDIDGLRSLISQAISWLSEDEGHTFNNFLAREGAHWRRATQQRGQGTRESHQGLHTNN